MARRATEKHIFEYDEASASGTESGMVPHGPGVAEGSRGDEGGAGGTWSGSGGWGGGVSASVSGGGDTVAPRKSFVAKRGWGTMKMVEVREENPEPVMIGWGGRMFLRDRHE